MAALSRFYHPYELKEGAETEPDADTSKHIVQVLRMQAGKELELTDGKGTIAKAVITVAEKRKCKVQVLQTTFTPQPQPALHLCAAFTKNAARNEWILEKATEMGVRSITPLSTARTEREKIKKERWQNILVSAMMQSQQAYLPELSELTTLDETVRKFDTVAQKLIAHCIEDIARTPLDEAMKPNVDTVLLIGPEGDFAQEEVTNCTGKGYKSVLLGNNRLRTETAAIAACAYFYMINSK